tara:strand:- start:4516 stop:6174 length:1659 start_codon:yes stop_codon:yes gene_type:complete
MRNLTHTTRSFIVYNLVLTSVLMLVSCGNRPQEKFDLVIYNAILHDTKGDSIHEALDMEHVWIGINDGLIMKVGSYNTANTMPGSIRSIDLNGEHLYPGFIDAHGHLFAYAEMLSTVNLVGATTMEECLVRIRKYITAHPGQLWIQGHGWDQNDWPTKQYPKASDLSEFKDVNIYLSRIDGHAAWINSRVLTEFGITNDIVINGGEIMDGVLIDNACSLVTLPKSTNQFWRSALLRAQDSLIKYGLTAMTDAGLDKEQIFLLDSLQTEGKLHLTINAMITNTEENLSFFEKYGAIEKPLLRVKSVKAYLDGALGSWGALLRTPYHDLPQHYGLPLLTYDELNTLRDRCLRNQWQLCVHAIGDSAHHLLLKSFNELDTAIDLRFRVEHAQIMTPEDSAYYTHPNITASVQPTHATSDMYWAEERLGPHRIHHAYSYKRLLNAAGILALGTDFPFEHIDPLATFYAATTRKDNDNWPTNGFIPTQAISPKEALTGMTYGASYAAFGEHQYGSIRIGQRANFTILNSNLLDPKEDQRSTTNVIGTVVNGHYFSTL